MRIVASKVKHTLQELVEWRTELKDKNLKLVVTNGCFDLLHLGHVAYLEQARALGDVLLVGVNTDENVRLIKGVNRPLNTQDDRVKVIAALESVDMAFIFQGRTAASFLAMVMPDVWVKGGDYTLGGMDQDERRTLEDLGAQIKFMPFIEGKSTSLIVNKIGDGKADN